jgi:hypothetical protein
VTGVPTEPEVTEYLLTVGRTKLVEVVKFVAEVAFASTLDERPIRPKPAATPAGTPTITLVALRTTNGAFAPLTVAPDVSSKLLPVIVIDVPGPPVVGVKLEILGVGLVKVNTAEDAVPPGVVTAIGPVLAPVGTIAVIEVLLTTLNEAAADGPNFTKVAPVKLVPVIVTEFLHQVVEESAVIVGARYVTAIFNWPVVVINPLLAETEKE